jgi:hypothetical protein
LSGAVAGSSPSKLLDVGGGTVQKRNLAELLVGDWESTLEATVVILKLITPPLFQLNVLAKDFLMTTGRCVRNE